MTSLDMHVEEIVGEYGSLGLPVQTNIPEVFVQPAVFFPSVFLMLHAGSPKAQTGSNAEVANNGYCVPVPIPSCPSLLMPQHLTVPSLRIAQLKPLPLVRLVAPARPLTVIGMSDLLVVPSPSWPDTLLPQHLIVLSERRAQLNVSLLLICWTLFRFLTVAGSDE